MFKSIDNLQSAMEKADYVCEPSLATAIYLAQKLGKPLLLEGQAGVGKTEVAKVLAEILQTKLIRLQCYDGLDSGHALYEWNYPRQILAIKLAQAQGHLQCATLEEEIEKDIFSKKFLLTRPLMEAITSESGTPVVLLIDEIDRAAAGVVAAAIAAPVLCVARRHVHVDRRIGRTRYDEHRLPIDQPGARKVADVDVSVEARLPDRNGHADVGGEGRYGRQGEQGAQQYLFHVRLPDQ